MITETATRDEPEGVRLVRDSVAAVAPRGDLKRIRALRFTTPGIDRAIWRQMAELGWLALRVPEVEDGLGMGMQEFCAIAEELGAGLVPEPILAAAAITPFLPDPWRQQAIAGDLIILPAWQEQLGGFAADTGVRFKSGRLNGRKILVPFAVAADAFLVTTDAGLALVHSTTKGVSIDHRQSQDGGHFATLDFVDAEAEPVAGTLDQALEEIMLTHAAYLFGAAQQAFAMTLEYLGIRKQFGKFIGAFQVLQHRAAELKIQIELSRAVLNEAISAMDTNVSADTRLKATSRAKARIADTAILLAKETIQMHGAVGITDEYDIGLFCRKILSLYNLYGTAAWHRARYLRVSGLPGSAI